MGYRNTRVIEPGYHKGREPANKGKTYPAEILTPDEVQRLIGACSHTSTAGIRDRALIVLLYRTGLRSQEALDLRLKDIDFDVCSVTVLHGKGDRRRMVGIDPKALEYVAAWVKRRSAKGHPPGAPLFCTSTGSKIWGGQLRTTLKQLGERAGIQKRVHAHGLRHTHAYELMMEKIPMPIIQRQLGHMSLATTDRYLNHIAPIQVIEEIRAREW